VCARYLNEKRTNSNIFGGIFLQGDTKFNIKNGQVTSHEKNKRILSGLFGTINKDELQNEPVMKKYYGIARNGFNVISCQFAIHYFWESETVFRGFLQNVKDNCKDGGYFIGTTYDGRKVFDELRTYKKGESISGINNDKTLWRITKQYDKETFSKDDAFGYAIDVYQESINQTIREYLVHIDTMTTLLKEYGFEVPYNETELYMNKDAKPILNIPEPIGNFDILYRRMIIEKETYDKSKETQKDLDSDKPYYGDAINLKKYPEQERLSFFNQFFIYKNTAKDVKHETSTSSSDTPTPSSDTSTPSSDTSIQSSGTSTPSSDTPTPSSDTPTPSSDTSTPSSDTSTHNSDASKKSNTNTPDNIVKDVSKTLRSNFGRRKKANQTRKNKRIQKTT